MALDEFGNVIPTGGDTTTDAGVLSDVTSPETTDLTGADTAIDPSVMRTGSEYIEPSATVRGQLSSLLADDSPYIQEARLSAQEQSAGRGLLNTTTAARAGERAAIQSGLPIAQQDASTFASASSQQQAGDIQGVLAGDKFKYDLGTIQESGKVEGSLAGEKYGYDVGLVGEEEGSASRLSMQAWDQSMATMSQEQINALEMADKEFGFSTQLKQQEQDFQQGLAEKGYSEARVALLSTVYSGLSQEFLKDMAGMYMSDEVSVEEAAQAKTNFDLMSNNFAVMLGFEDLYFGE